MMLRVSLEEELHGQAAGEDPGDCVGAGVARHRLPPRPSHLLLAPGSPGTGTGTTGAGAHGPHLIIIVHWGLLRW